MKPKSIKFATMTIHEAGQRLLFQLYHLYGNDEAGNIADWIMENITGWKRVDRILHKHTRMSDRMQALLEIYIIALNERKPVQYILNEAWFYGMKFFVDENVLIPRPETEELIEWIMEDVRHSTNKQISILDIGTGSGCIPIVLKKKIPSATIYACDVSGKALEVAKKNALDHHTEIIFIETDIFNDEQRNNLPEVDIVVSNPPYIPFSEKDKMGDNVVRYEPHIALFVEDDDPLVFYRAIATLPSSLIFVETHEDLAKQTLELFQSKEFSCAEIRKDMQGKDRMIRACKQG